MKKGAQVFTATLLTALALSPIAMQAATAKKARTATTRATTHEIVSLVPKKPVIQKFTGKIQSIDYNANRITAVAHNQATGVDMYIYVNYTDATVISVNGVLVSETQLVPLTMLKFSGTWAQGSNGSLEVSNVTNIVAHPPAGK